MADEPTMMTNEEFAALQEQLAHQEALRSRQAEEDVGKYLAELQDIMYTGSLKDGYDAIISLFNDPRTMNYRKYYLAIERMKNAMQGLYNLVPVPLAPAPVVVAHTDLPPT